MSGEILQFRPREAVRKVYPIEGANALALQPEASTRPFLQLVKPLVPERTPVSLQDYRGKRARNLIVPLGEKLSDPALRQQQLEGEPETERFIEREMDPEKPWSAFGQIMFIKEHIVDGKRIKKIAAISIAYPGGVGTKMAGEILQKTIGVDRNDFEEPGLKEGSLIATAKEVDDVTQNLSLMEDFIENSGLVIQGKHAQADHEIVRHFFKLQDPRRDFIKTVQEDALAILNNPEFTGWSAVNDEYKDKGVYLVEMTVGEDGVLQGGDTQGRKVPLKGVVVDEPHLKWVLYAGDKIYSLKGDGVLGHAESTETVTDCGGRKGCSEFFSKMESGLNKLKEGVYSVVSGIMGAISSSSSQLALSFHKSGGGYAPETNYCSTCNVKRNSEGSCNCSK